MRLRCPNIPGFIMSCLPYPEGYQLTIASLRYWEIHQYPGESLGCLHLEVRDDGGKCHQLDGCTDFSGDGRILEWQKPSGKAYLPESR